ncbi:PEPxxWA-CTERM sorting domain-containing protein [Sphingomonas sp. RS2018]
MIMSLKIIALALAASTVLAGAADAAVITKTYQVTSKFSSGPYSSIVTTFDATYDPAPISSGGNAVTLSNFSTTGGASFGNEDAGFYYNPAKGSRPEQRLLVIGGAGRANSFSENGIDDFEIDIAVSSSGEALGVLGVAYTLDYVLYQGTGALTDASISAAVPEPATWAMMLVGFGMVGAASRYRRRSTVTAFA